MYAVNGKLLSVNLSDGRLDTEKISFKQYKKYMGGYGLGIALLMEMMDPSADALGPDNILGFAAGYLTGTGAYIASRFMVFGKSPSTGGWGDSNCGAHFGKKMKQAGFDMILFSGQSEKPVYLYINEGKAELIPCTDIWGSDTFYTEDFLKEKHGKSCQVACIGPAGERMTAMAGISTDKGRYAARSGLGAVMGSKNLKALVVDGNFSIDIKDPEKLKDLRKEYVPVFKEEFPSILGKYGTAMFYNLAMHEGDAPFKNWSSSVEEYPGKDNTVDEAETILELQSKRYACQGCPIACGGHVEVKSGPFKTDGLQHKAEYETMGVFGSNLLNDNMESLQKLNEICNRWGIDTITTGGLCGYAIESYQNGFISKEQTGGLELAWSDPEVILKLVEKIGKNEGIGAILTRGFEAAIEEFGEETRKYAMAVRNEGLPAHDPRWSDDLALTYYTDATPSRHTQGCTTFPVAGYTMPEGEDSQAAGHRDNVNLYHTLSSLGLCIFGFSVFDYHNLPEFFEAIDGTRWTMEDFDKAGARIHLLRHMFNLKAGIRYNDFTFPERVIGPLHSGKTEGNIVPLDKLVKDYEKQYRLDPETLIPDRSILKELDIAHLG